MCSKHEMSRQECMYLETKVNKDSLMKWFKENGGLINEAIELGYDPSYGHHHIAKSRAINSQEVICTCPFSLTLSHLNVLSTPQSGVRNCSKESVSANLIGKVDHSTVAAFFLAEQRLKGKESFWHPYIQTLPDEAEMTTPLWFKDQEFAYLRGTNLLPQDIPREQTSVGLWESRHKGQWISAVTALKKAGESTENFTWKLFLWAATIFTSRSFTSKVIMSSNSTVDMLCPVVDIFNHHPNARVSWQFNMSTFSLQLEERVEQGQQVFNNYAAKGNEELLMGYGFCIADNPCDQVVFRLGQVPPEIHRRLRERVPSRWRSETWNPQESIFYIRGKSHQDCGYSEEYGLPQLVCLRGIPPELTISVYVIMLGSHEVDNCPEQGGNATYLWAGVLDTLLQQAETSLLAITRWDSELPRTPPTVGAHAAMLYRTGQRRVLDEVIAELKEFMDPLRSGEIDVRDAFRGKLGLM